MPADRSDAFREAARRIVRRTSIREIVKVSEYSAVGPLADGGAFVEVVLFVPESEVERCEKPKRRGRAGTTSGASPSPSQEGTPAPSTLSGPDSARES